MMYCKWKGAIFLSLFEILSPRLACINEIEESFLGMAQAGSASGPHVQRYTLGLAWPLIPLGGLLPSATSLDCIVTTI